MAALVDYVVQDCEALFKAIDENRTAMSSKGFNEGKYNALLNAKDDLILKEAAQQKAVKLVEDKTAAQNETVQRVIKVIQKIKDAAKSGFGKDERHLKIFKVGDAIQASVKKLRPLCEYFAGIVLEYNDILIANGMDQTDIDAFHSSYGDLVAVDATQENSKKLQMTSTMNRNNSLKKLQEEMFKVRSFAKSCFSGNPEIVLQFKPIPKGAGRKGEGNTPPPDGQPGQ